MRSTLAFVISWIVVVITPQSLTAQPYQLEIPFGNYQIESSPGHPATLYLKRELRHLYPDIEPSELVLRKVVLVARSRHGQGLATLRVGQSVTSPRRVGGGRHRFEGHRSMNKHRLRFPNPSLDSRGAWQMLLDGRFVINKVVLVVHKKRKYKPEGVFEHPVEQYPPSDRLSNNFNKPQRQGAIVLPNRVWGTDMEGEKSCSRYTSNAPDGWSKPQNVCRQQGEARFAKGYRPIKIYIRPDASVLKQDSNHSVEGIRVGVTAVRSANTRRTTSATLGIDIGGETFTRKVHVTSVRNRGTKVLKQTLLVDGRWRPDELHNAKVWVRPNQSTEEIKIRQLTIEAMGV